MDVVNSALNVLRIDLSPPLSLIWGVFAAVMLTAVIMAVLMERRRYRARNQSGAWLIVRLSTLPAFALAVAAAVMPAHAVSGPEALAAFFLLLFSITPLVYFGLHWFAGYMAGLSRSDSFLMGFTGLLILLVPAVLASLFHPWAFILAQAVDKPDPAQSFSASHSTLLPLPHQITHQQRFMLPEIGEIWTEHWIAPVGVHVERIELEVHGNFAEVSHSESNYLCQDGDDIHVFWHGAVPPAKWRMYWRDGNNQRAYSDWLMTPPAAEAVAFTPEWRPDGFTLPVPVPASMINYVWMTEDNRLASQRAFENTSENAAHSVCLQTVQRPVTEQQRPVHGVGVRLWRFDIQQMLYVLLERPITPSEHGP